MTTVTDEMRAAGLAALHADSEWHKPGAGGGSWRANYQRAVDLVLQAAVPLLAPQPVVDREALLWLFTEYGVVCRVKPLEDLAAAILALPQRKTQKETGTRWITGTHCACGAWGSDPNRPAGHGYNPEVE